MKSLRENRFIFWIGDFGTLMAYILALYEAGHYYVLDRFLRGFRFHFSSLVSNVPLVYNRIEDCLLATQGFTLIL